MAHDIDSPGVWRPGQRGETQAEKLHRMKTGPATTTEAKAFVQNYHAQPDTTSTSNPNETKKSTFYGGFILQKGDNDKKKTWSGKLGDKADKWVEELQKDLLKIGYWISDPAAPKQKGMNADGDFGLNVENAVKTAQLELLSLAPDGAVDKSKKNKITGKIDSDTAKAIKDCVAAIGTKKWDRRGHKPKSQWEEPAGTGDYTTNQEFNPADVLFYQLPPSEGYYRTLLDFGSRDIKKRATKPTFRAKPFQIYEDEDANWLLADCWGTKEQIDLLKGIGDKWLKTEDGKNRTVKLLDGTEHNVQPFCVGDLSAFNGGALVPHSGHRSGNETDLNRADGTSICSAQAFSKEADREQTLELCKLIAAAGAKNIYFNCHYVISNVDIAQFCELHSNHIHFDGQKSAINSPDKYQKKTTCKDCGILDICEERIYKVRDGSVEAWATAKEYDTEKTYEFGKGVRIFADKKGNHMVLSKREWGALPSDQKTLPKALGSTSLPGVRGK